MDSRREGAVRDFATKAQAESHEAKLSPPVPVSPVLRQLLRKHIANYGTAPDGRLFQGEGGGLLSDSIYGRVWDKARRTALTPAEAASPLADDPTICAMRACPPGSTQVSQLRKSPNGRATASRFSSACTPNA